MSAAPGITIESRGAAKAAHALKELGDRGSDIRRVSEKVRRVYRDSNRRRFDGGGRWPPLAPATVERKARLGLDPRPERATGALYRALTSARAAGQIDVRERTEFRFGTTLSYALPQHGSKTQPRRDLIDLTPAERKQIDDLIGAWIARAQA